MIRDSVHFTGRAFRFLSAEVRGLHAAVYVLAVSSLLSSILALARDRLLAHAFGASTTLDIYYASFRIPDLIFVAIGALVSVYILIPELARRSTDEQRDYIDTILCGFSLLAVVVSILAAVFAPAFVTLLFPKQVALGQLPHIVMLTRIMLLQPILLGLSNILASITQARQRYTLYALSPLLYNMGIIFGITVFYPLWGIAGLAWGVVLGAAMHLSIQVPSILADGFFERLPRIHDTRALLHTVSVSVPRALALSMNQITFLALVALAGSLPPGSIAVFMFGFNLQAVPLGVIGASYSVAAFPTLAAALSKGERQEFITHVATAARYVFFWSIPASALILVLRAHIVRVILGSGAFDWTDTRLTAAAFALFSFSLASQGLMLLLVRGYYAAGRTFVPFLVSIGVTALAIALGAASILLLQFEGLRHAVEVFMRVEDLTGSTVLGLIFAYSFATIIGSIVLLAHFELRFSGFFAKISRSLWQSIVVAFVAGYAAHIFLTIVSAFTVSSAALTLFVQGATSGVFGIVVAACAYYLLGSTEYREVWASVHSRLWKPATQEVSLLASAEENPRT
jgi:putative peptidoglycan lipid II flippase